jgi:hypothetical protein
LPPSPMRCCYPLSTPYPLHTVPSPHPSLYQLCHPRCKPSFFFYCFAFAYLFLSALSHSLVSHPLTHCAPHHPLSPWPLMSASMPQLVSTSFFFFLPLLTPAPCPLLSCYVVLRPFTHHIVLRSFTCHVPSPTVPHLPLHHVNTPGILCNVSMPWPTIFSIDYNMF